MPQRDRNISMDLGPDCSITPPADHVRLRALQMHVGDPRPEPDLQAGSIIRRQTLTLHPTAALLPTAGEAELSRSSTEDHRSCHQREVGSSLLLW